MATPMSAAASTPIINGDAPSSRHSLPTTASAGGGAELRGGGGGFTGGGADALGVGGEAAGAAAGTAVDSTAKSWIAAAGSAAVRLAAGAAVSLAAVVPLTGGATAIVRLSVGASPSPPQPGLVSRTAQVGPLKQRAHAQKPAMQ